MDNWIVITLTFYVIVQMAIAFAVSRFIKTEADYVAAGRHLGVFMASMSLFATWFGAETVMASSGAIAAEGLAGGRADPFGYALCLLFFAIFIAYRMREKAYLTSGDFYRDRFNAPTEKLAVFVQVLTSTVWAAAQVLAFGHVIAAVTGMDLNLSIMAGLLVVIVYTMMGGFLGDVITDVVQGFVLIAGLAATLLFIILHMGGWNAAWGTVSVSQLALFTDAQPLGIQIDEWAIAILGSLTAQEAMSRILATRTPEIARRASFAASGIYLFVGLIPAAIGLLGSSILPPDEAVTDNYLPRLAEMILPTPVYVIFLGALISAILSTIGSTILSITALIGHNIIQPLRPGLSEQARVRLQRGLAVIVGVVLYFIATGGTSIYDLIVQTSSFGSAGLLVVMIAGLWLRAGGPWTGFVTVAAGIGLTFLTQSVWEWQVAYLASLAGCVVIYAAGSRIEKRFAA